VCLTCRIAACLALVLASGLTAAHGVADSDAAFLERQSGLALAAFTYLGAKHMVTGYDHLLYLLAVIFFLYRLRDVALYVTMFAVGHSVTLLAGVLSGIDVNPFFVDGIIGLSIVYKAFENLGGFQRVFGITPNQKIAVFGFGLIHGFGLATKLQELALSEEGLIGNMLAFNVGVELGQLLALSLLVLLVVTLRSSKHFARYANVFNVLLMFAGFTLAAQQFAGLVYAPV